MTGERVNTTDHERETLTLDELRQAERLFESKHECSPAVNKVGRKLLRVYQESEVRLRAVEAERDEAVQREHMSGQMEEVVDIDWGGQIVGPCVVLKKRGLFLRLQIPVKGGYYRLRWVPRWRVIA